MLLDKCIRDINQHLRSTLAPPNNMHVMKMNSLLELVMQLRITQSQLTALNLLQKVSATVTVCSMLYVVCLVRTCVCVYICVHYCVCS